MTYINAKPNGHLKLVQTNLDKDEILFRKFEKHFEKFEKNEIETNHVIYEIYYSMNHDKKHHMYQELISNDLVNKIYIFNKYFQTNVCDLQNIEQFIQEQHSRYF